MAEAPRVLNERYEVESTLGRGGMAQVYRANDLVLGRPVAVKILSRKLSGDQKFLTRFRREAQASAGLNHPHVVSVYDTGAHDDLHYIVMEYVEGETLASLMAREGPLPPERAARIAADVAEALEAAHRQGVVHRDVKPGNVMIDPDGPVKVVDFGIARAATDDTLTQTGLVLGTAAYLSPEQARGEGVDARSDIYSLGCVLYEMLTGRPPFQADSSVAMAYKHVNDRPHPPAGAVPPELATVVMRALEKDPDLRFQTAAEMQAALMAALPTGPMAPTRPVTAGGDTAVMPPAEAPPPGRSRRWWIAAAVIGGLLAILGIALLAVAGPDPREARREARQPAREQENQPPPDQGPLSVDRAYTRLTGSITEGVAVGEVDEEASDELLGTSEEALAAYEAGDLTGALGKLSELNQQVTEYAEAGRVAGDRAFSIQQAAEDLEVAMQAVPPSPPPVGEEEEEGDEGSSGEGDEESSGEGDEGSSGPGSGEPQGKAKGHDKDKGKGEKKD